MRQITLRKDQSHKATFHSVEQMNMFFQLSGANPSDYIITKDIT